MALLEPVSGGGSSTVTGTTGDLVKIGSAGALADSGVSSTNPQFTSVTTPTLTGTSGAGLTIANGAAGQVTVSSGIISGGNVNVTGDVSSVNVTASKRITTGIITVANNTVAVDASLGHQVNVTATSIVTLSNPTNGVDAQQLTYRIKNSSVAAISFGNAFSVGTDIVMTNCSGSNLYDYLQAVYCAASSKWHVVSFVKGYG